MVSENSSCKNCNYSSAKFWGVLLGVWLVTILLMGECGAQTFQYSRGWTNGKRSGRDNYSPVTSYDYGGAIPPPPSSEGELQDEGLRAGGRARNTEYNQMVSRRTGGRGGRGIGKNGQSFWALDEE